MQRASQQKMSRYYTALIIAGLILLIVASFTAAVFANPVSPSSSSMTNEKVFMNQFAVLIKGDLKTADKIAEKHGFVNLGQIGTLDNYYLFEHHHISRRSLDRSYHHHSLLENESNIGWVQQQVELTRRKRDLFDEFHKFSMPAPSFLRSHFANPLLNTGFPDPLYSEQWYLNGGALGGYDMNVKGVWKRGITGRGVVVSILDDGIQTNHPDLIQNYDPHASTDINGNDNDPLPQDNGDNKHGTRCAGEVAATAYNGICGVGIAYNASIGGVRMLDGTVNDAVEARALSHNPNHIDIYSASWGPEDDGKTVDGPGPLARKAFLDGVTKGRNRKGSIFIWASGNGGLHEDSCNCDGYTNSIYTLSISSATQHGLKPWYLEECSSTLATTYSSGTRGHDQSVITVDMDMSFNKQLMCTKEHTGTSASAPIAAAICALALEVNPHLTWRDMQYLVVFTSNPEPMSKESGWITNGVHRKVSHKFGYGLMDADAMVSLAERWRGVPPQHVCEMPPDTSERMIPNEFGSSVEFYLDTDGCYGTRRVVNHLEHVQAKISLNFNPRGNLRIVLQSPYGTSSTLLFPRPRDIYKSNFDDWPFLSVHFWGERPAGRWRLTIINSGTKQVIQPGILKKWSLVFHGTDVNPIQNLMPSPLGSFDFMPFAASSVSQSSVLSAEASNKSLKVSDDDSSSTQKNCHVECLGGCYGDGPENCVACKNLVIDESSNHMCVAECPDGWYATSDLKCHKCYGSCRTCSGGGSRDCLTCQPSLLRLHIAGETQCTDICPEGFFNDLGISCNPCSSVCKHCHDNAEKCTECSNGFVLFNKTCVTSCPNGTYNDGNGRCFACDPTCETCVGASLLDCDTCSQHLFYLNGTCVKFCPSGYFHNETGNHCYSCNSTCLTCNSSQCLTCVQGHDGGQCEVVMKDECPPGTCAPCHVSCNTCSGSTYSQCTTCYNDKFLFKNICLDNCPQGFYLFTSGNCLPCPEGCKLCFGGDLGDCLSCFQHFLLENGSCTSGCDSGFYRNNGACNKCHASCKLCKGAGISDCIMCPIGKTLIERHCVTECALGYFYNGERCVPCHNSCRTCRGSNRMDCLSCHGNNELVNGICTSCGTYQYFDSILETCLGCNETCLTCSGPDAYSCVTCAEPLKHEPTLQQCVSCCTDNFHQDCCHCDQLNNVCLSTSSTIKRGSNGAPRSASSGTYGSHRRKSPTATNTFVSAVVGASVLLVTSALIIAIIISRVKKSSSNFAVEYTALQQLPNEINTRDMDDEDSSEEEEEETTYHFTTEMKAINI